MTEQAEKIQEQIKAERDLINRVFNNPDGRKLLQKWAATHIWSPQLHKDSNMLYARIGQQEFVTNILNCMGDNNE